MVTVEKFYVFYDHNDFVRCCGTSRELVARGFFKKINSVHASATHIKQGVRPGAVAILEGEAKGFFGQDRYATEQYRAMFPLHWSHAKYVHSAQDLAGQVGEFWKES